MRYEELEPIAREEAERCLAGDDPAVAGTALLRLALHDPDWRYVYDRCVEVARHEDLWVRRNSATAIGHLARLHTDLDADEVAALLHELANDPDVRGFTDSAFDDLEVFQSFRPVD